MRHIYIILLYIYIYEWVMDEAMITDYLYISPLSPFQVENVPCGNIFFEDIWDMICNALEI